MQPLTLLLVNGSSKSHSLYLTAGGAISASSCCVWIYVYFNYKFFKYWYLFL